MKVKIPIKLEVESTSASEAVKDIETMLRIKIREGWQINSTIIVKGEVK